MEIRKVNQEFIWDVLISPDKWEANGLDPVKGICLMGKPGVGKSYFMELYSQRNSKICWGHPKMPRELGLLDCRAQTIKTACERQGIVFLQQFQDHELYLDDLGSESQGTTNHFGTQIDPITELIQIRYSVRKTTKTNITTNCNLEKIEEIYGDRFADRIPELCNILILDGKSFRK